jgi:hypothetical protein
VNKQRSLSNLRPFNKGDPRINRRSRPKSFDQFRELAQAIAHEKIIGSNGDTITVAEQILRAWAKSKQPTLQKAFIEYAFGKVPDKLDAIGLENKTVLRPYFDHELEYRDPGAIRVLQPPDDGASHRLKGP